MVPQPPNILICLVLVWFPKVVLLNIRRYEKIKSWLSMAWESIRTRYLHQHGIRHAWASRTGGARVFLTPGVGFCVYVEYKVRFQWCLSWTWDFACVYFRLGVGVDGARVSGGVVEVRQHGVRGSLRVLFAWPLRPKFLFIHGIAPFGFCPRKLPQVFTKAIGISKKPCRQSLIGEYHKKRQNRYK